MCKVSIIMPVYNVESYVGAAMESILNQTFQNFEFLIFNDGSTDNSADVIRSYKEDRIKFFNYKENTGYVKHLNYGITIAEGKYIARMDADDVSHRERLQKQVDFMEANPDVGVCGSWYDIIGDSNNIIKVPAIHDDLKVQLLLNSVFGHPSVIMRTKVLKDYNKFYDHNYMPAEDFKLWVELSRVNKLANLQEVLLHYRRHEGQISNYKQQLQLEKIQSVKVLQVEYLLDKKLSFEEQQIVHFLFGNSDESYSTVFLNKALQWAYKLIKVNKEKKIYDNDKLESLITSQIKSKMYSLQYSKALLFNEGKKLLLNHLSIKNKIKFYLKSLLNW